MLAIVSCNRRLPNIVKIFVLLMCGALSSTLENLLHLQVPGGILAGGAKENVGHFTAPFNPFW